jgi:tetratricopeptide (TPR) repeat protein
MHDGTIPDQAGSAVKVTFKPAIKRSAPYIPAIGPALRILLYSVFAGFAILGGTGVYLLVITALNRAYPEQLFTTPFTFWMIIAHTGLGLLGMIPFLIFGGMHWFTSRKRPNRVAVKLGIVLFALGILVGMSGIALIQLEGFPQLPTGSIGRNVIYFLHVLLPFAAIMAYVVHRRAGPPIKWKYGKQWAVGVCLLVGLLASMHLFDPRRFDQAGPVEGMQYFSPSLARTADGNFIPETALMMDEYCMKCHGDVYKDHLHSAHKFSSFNNPAYLFSVVETRKVALERDGKINASRWCAGCHDPVPFFSGKFDDPNYDIKNDSTAHAGVSCVVCHSITHVDAPVGNAAYTIEEAQHYPFANSTNPGLQWINNQLIKAKPEFHKKTFLKPLHKSAEFCSTCHKVSLPVELNHYKEFLRGQNHYDSFVLSGMGNGSRSFYFPPSGAKDNCASCHMPLAPSKDFGSKDFDGSGERKRHNHFFPAANTGLFELLKHEERYKDQELNFQASIDQNANFLRGTAADGSDKKLRIDLFGLKRFLPDGTVDDASLQILRPNLPPLTPGKEHLIEVVIRTLNIGHHFSQGTVDSNEIWVDFEATADGKVIGRNGALSNPKDETGEVDPRSHFINVHMLDRHGNRIDRRNPQDIFTPLYDKQIPPGAGQVVHYKLKVPENIKGPVELKVKLRYRKFDYKYMEYVHKEKNAPIPKLPIVDIAMDRILLPVEGGTKVDAQESPIKPAWQRVNDYGIGCLLEGGVGLKKGNLKQAEKAFQMLLQMGPDAVPNGHLNLARVYNEQGRLDDAIKQLNLAQSAEQPAPWWAIAWFNGLVTAQNATGAEDLDRAINYFEKIVNQSTRPLSKDGKGRFDFSRDFVVLAELGRTRFKRSQLEVDDPASQQQMILKSIEAYDRALAVDPEDLDSHYGLSQCYSTFAGVADASNLDQGNSLDPSIESLTTLSSKLRNPKLSIAERKHSSEQLSQLITALGKRAPDAKNPKLPVIRNLLSELKAAFTTELNIDAKRSIAMVLADLHRESHTIYKPDELARSRTTAEYRAKNPAANAAAEAIVIYPTQPK